MTSKTIREGGDSVEPGTSRTAAINESQSHLLAALKVTSWETTLLDVWLAEQSMNHALTLEQESWIRHRIQNMREAQSAIAKAEGR